jgi:hypothetical protein
MNVCKIPSQKGNDDMRFLKILFFSAVFLFPASQARSNENKIYKYDELGRMVLIQTAITSGRTTQDSYSYDASGNRTKVVLSKIDTPIQPPTTTEWRRITDENFNVPSSAKYDCSGDNNYRRCVFWSKPEEPFIEMAGNEILTMSEGIRHVGGYVFEVSSAKYSLYFSN